MKIKKILITIFLLTASSCSYLIRGISDNKIKVKVPESKICHLQSDYLFIGENSSLVKVFQENYKSWNLSKKELIYAWTLANSIVRPDMINASSFGGVFLIQNENIEFLNQNNFKSIRFNKIVSLLNAGLPNKFKVSKALSSKLSEIKNSGGKIPNKFKIANQVLGTGEIFKRKSLSKKPLFQTRSNAPTRNIKAEGYQCLGFERSDQKSPTETSLLSIYHKEWQAIIIHSNIKKQDLLKPQFSLPNSSVCYHKNNYYENTYVSYLDPNHDVLLKNLINLGIEKIQSIEDLIYYINYPRFVLEKDSKYILMESLRADKTLENYINTLNIPIYHKNNIGKIQSLYRFSNNRQSGVLMDPREPNTLRCSNND